MQRQISQVRQFHETFGCAIAQEPGFPEMDRGDLRMLNYYAKRLASFARQLKVEAAEANQRGAAGLGLMLVRMQLHVEEGAELMQAMADLNLVEALDAITDINYVNQGTTLALGLASLSEPAFDVIHNSNMSKLGEDGQPIISDAGRVVKGPRYWSPKQRLTALLESR